MSTNKTEHFGLHSWVPEDELHLSEINENFEMLDQSVRVLAGKYTSNHRVELGVKPLMVFTTCATNDSTSLAKSGIATQSMPLGTALILDESGFTAGYDSNIGVRLAYLAYPYNYIVFY